MSGARSDVPAPVAARAAARPALLPLIAVALGVLLLLSLGVWQVERLQWKTALLARIAALQAAPAEPLSAVLNRLPGPGVSGGGEVDFVRVQFDCPRLEQGATVHLYAILEGVLGERLITACPLTGGRFGSILVDRGFVSAERLGLVGAGATLAVPVVGVLRRPETASWIAPPNRPARNDWHSRDIAAMARALGARDPAPVMLMLESPAPAGGGPPRPAAIPTNIPNNHLGYALTWFGLAAGLVGVYLGHLRRRPTR